MLVCHDGGKTDQCFCWVVSAHVYFLALMLDSDLLQPRDQMSPLVVSVSGSSYTRETSCSATEAVFTNALAEHRVHLFN